MLEALSRYRHEDLQNGLDLWRSIAGQDGGRALDIHNPDVLTGLRGHLGEQVAADHLSASGHTVVMPESGSNPGWDFDVDHGVFINGKISGDAAHTAAAHFGDQPDVPILLNADAAHMPASAYLWDGHSQIEFADLADHGSVIADQSLTSADVMSQLTDAVPAIDPLSTLTDFSDAVPNAGAIIAVALSAKREFTLVRDGKTTATRATKNVAIDGTTRAVGFFAGAKVGAVAGATVDAASGMTTLGLGTVLGGIAGGVAGLVAAKKAAQHVRTAPLRNAGEILVGRLVRPAQHASGEGQLADVMKDPGKAQSLGLLMAQCQ